MLSHQLQELTKELIPVSETPALDAELLLAHVLGRNRNYVLANPTQKFSAEQLHKLDDLKRQRLRSRPVPYLTNKRDFWNSEFYVDDSVLIPRPETELLVEEALRELAGKDPQYVCDIGTGSGCIAVSLAQENPHHTYLATDISKDALRTASLNALKHRVKDNVTFYEGNLLEPLFHPTKPIPQDNLLIIANLPYVDMKEPVPAEPHYSGVPHEPRLALHGGRLGLDIPKQFVDQLKNYGIHDSIILMEIGAKQGGALYEYFKKQFPEADIGTARDLAGQERMMRIEI